MNGPSEAAVEAAARAIAEVRFARAGVSADLLTENDVMLVRDEARAALTAAYPLLMAGKDAEIERLRIGLDGAHGNADRMRKSLIAERDEARAAIDAVLATHKPGVHTIGGQTCAAMFCGDSWPCATAKACGVTGDE